MSDTALTEPSVQSATVGELALALAKVQSKLTNPPKDRTAKVQMKAGGTYSYNYADLASILDLVRPLLSAEGLALIQFPEVEVGGVAVRTVLAHKSGEWVGSRLAAKVEDSRPQSIGAAITYLRRYAAQSIVGIAAEEDDDAASTEKHASPRPAPQPTTAPPRPIAAPTAPSGVVASQAATDTPKSAPKPSEPPAGSEMWLCNIDRKSAPKETKKPGTFRYGFMTTMTGDDGKNIWVNTFDSSLASYCEAYMEEKRDVELTVKKGSYGYDIISVLPVGAVAADVEVM
jgi:hypothetical protein